MCLCCLEKKRGSGSDPNRYLGVVSLIMKVDPEYLSLTERGEEIKGDLCVIVFCKCCSSTVEFPV